MFFHHAKRQFMTLRDAKEFGLGLFSFALELHLMSPFAISTASNAECNLELSTQLSDEARTFFVLSSQSHQHRFSI